MNFPVRPRLASAASAAILLLFGTWAPVPASAATTLVRGPYLQSGTPASLVVRWRTSQPVTGRVRFGTNAAGLNGVIDGPAGVTNHAVLLTNLQPDTVYWYAIGTPTNIWAAGSNQFFRTAPPEGSRRPVRVWVLGDSGFTNQSAGPVRDAYYAYAAGRYTDVWLMLGDNAYTGGGDGIFQHAVFGTYPAMLRQTVLWSTIGNQETAGSATPAATIPYFEIFNFPVNGEAGGVPSGTEKYYSFNHGNVHFVCLDSMSSTRTAGSAMLQWLAQDLAANTSDWLIAFWHHPPYSKGSNDSDARREQGEMRTNAVALLEAHGVDLVLGGHSHSYERSFLIDGHYGPSSTWRTDYLRDGGDGRISGTGAYQKAVLGPAARAGALYVVAGSGSSLGSGPLNHPAMYRSLNRLGSLVLDIHANRLDGRFLRETGAIDDSFTIIKAASPLVLTQSNAAPAVTRLEWNAVADRTYHVEFTPQLVPAAWSNVSGPVRSGGLRAGWSADRAGSNGFFRVLSLGD